MSMEELGEATGFTNKNVFKDFLSRNPELLTEEFSFLRKVKNLEGGIVKNREKRFFNERGSMKLHFLQELKKLEIQKVCKGAYNKVSQKRNVTSKF